MRWLRAAALAVGVAASVFGASAQAAPALWRVRGPSADIYLFGTLHALKPGDRWRTPAYDAAYAQAQVIWFEADLGGADPTTVGSLVERYGVDPQRGLSQKLDAADFAALRGQTPDPGRIEHLRPWAAALMLSMQPVLAQGASVDSGADLTVTRQARGGGKTIRAFETLEDQIRMFASLPEAAEVRYLSDVIHERQGPRRRLRLRFTPSAASLERQWLDGDLARLGPGLVRGLGQDNPALYEVLLKRRNLAWADKLSSELASASGTELVNVGALHMVGLDGLPALLAARGYTVERVQ